eukprot:jgi/Hompol1/3626/HPOL_006653-RA
MCFDDVAVPNEGPVLKILREEDATCRRLVAAEVGVRELRLLLNSDFALEVGVRLRVVQVHPCVL